MAKYIVMPKLGLTMKEGRLIKWYVKEGDQVKAGDNLFSVETDKLSNDVEASEDGYIRKFIAEEGDVVPCLQPVAIIGEKDEDITSLLSEKAASSQEPQEIKTVAKEETKEVSREKVVISPAARKLAREKDVDIENIVGTGPRGRIVLKDVEEYIEKQSQIKITPAARKTAEQLGVDLAQLNKEGRIRKEDVYSFSKEQELKSKVSPVEESVPMTTMRKIIAERMTKSWNISPAVNYDIKVDVSKLQDIRNQLKSKTKVTYTDLLVRIVSKTLLEFPLLNCTIEGEEIIHRNYVNMGVAVALEEGLLVPVIKYAHAKGLRQISKEIKELADKAKNNELTEDEIVGGTFTITNIGMFGIESFTPIINQPEVAILGINTIVETPVVEKGEIKIKPLMNLSLTADHRAVDGAVAAQFLARVKEYIENPAMLLL